MKFRTTPSFDRDWKRLPDEHKRIFRERLGDFTKACDAFAADKAVGWPAALRVSRLTGTKSIWEMTWSLAGPDGRGTFEFILDEGGLYGQWRRIGDHSIYVNAWGPPLRMVLATEAVT